MNTTLHKMLMIWAIILVMGLLYACPDTVSGYNAPTPILTAGDITYDKDRVVQGTADTATPTSSTISDFSGLIFTVESINTYVGTGTQVLPTIAEDGIITTTTTTSAGSYRVTITPDGSVILGDPITVNFYVTVKAMDTADLDEKLAQAIADYGLTGDFNYIDTSDVTDMSYLFRSGYTPGTGEEDATRTYVEGFNGDISQWDTSAVEDFSYMFNGAADFSQDLSDWSVDSTDTTIGMFKGSGVVSLPNWYAPTSITAGDITYDKDRIAQGTADTATPTSSTISDFSGLIFTVESINTYVGTGTQVLPTIAEDGIITTTTTTSAGSYRVTITPDGSVILGDPITVNFYVTVKAMDTADLDEKLAQAIADYGLTGDFNYIDTSDVTDMSYLFRSGYTPGTGEEDATRTYVEGFNGDISQWDTSAVEDFSYMFNGAADFSQDLSDWSVDSTDTTIGMFKDSGVVSLPNWYAPTSITAGDITYDKDRIAQGTADTATPTSLTIIDFSGLIFTVESINTYVGTGTHELPTIAEDGTITTTTTTSAGSYRVTITPDGSVILGDPITVNFYVTVKPADTAELDTMLAQAIADYGLTGDFNYIDTSAVTDMSYLFRSGYTPGTGEEDATRTYVEGFNGDISQWDTSAVEDFSYMFNGAADFSQDLSDWSVDSTDTTIGMFKDSGVVSLPNWYAPTSITAGDITYDKDRIAQGTADTATPTSSTISDFSGLIFTVESINAYVGTGTQVLPTIAEDGIITTTATTSAGSYRVTITPDGSIFTGDPITVNFYVTVKPADTAELDTMLAQAITDYGLTGDFNYIDTSAVTDMSYLFRSGYTPSTGEEDATRTYVEGFNGDISQWDVSAVEDFSSMFNGAADFSQDLSDWSVDSTDTTIGMFKGSGVASLPDWYAPTSITAEDITYDKDRVVQGTADTATPTSTTITDFSGLIFTVESINAYVGTGTQVLPTIAEDGIITTTTTTSAGSYRVTITPDGSIFTGDPITVNFYVTVKPADTAELDTMLAQAIADYGLTGDFNYIDTSAVTDMSYLFRSGYTPGTGEEDATRTYVEGFNGDISQWDVSAVEDFSSMFNGAADFSQDLSDWSVDSTDIKTGMFKDSGVVSLPNWYAPTSITAGDITYDKDRIAQGTADTATPTSSTISDFSGLIFTVESISTPSGTQVLPTIVEDGSIATTATTSAGSYRVIITPDGNTFTGDPFIVDFYVTVKPVDIADLDVKLTQAIADYGLTGDFNYIDTSAVTDMSYLFRSGYTPGTGVADSTRTYVAGFNGDISQWDTSAVEDFSYMFSNAALFNQDIGGWNVSAGKIFSNMFRGAEVFNQDIGGWVVEIGEDFSSMFSGAAEFNQNIGGWKVSAGINFNFMFFGAKKFNQDIGDWIVSKGQYFASMFYGAIAFNQNIGRWTVSSSETFNSMFFGAVAFDQNISDWDVSNATNFNSMFSGAEMFNQNIGNWIVSNGTSFSNMFNGAIAFDQDLSEWQIDATDTTSGMFTNSGVTNLPSWYTP